MVLPTWRALFWPHLRPLALSSLLSGHVPTPPNCLLALGCHTTYRRLYSLSWRQGYQNPPNLPAFLPRRKTLLPYGPQLSRPIIPRHLWTPPTPLQSC